MHKSNNTLFMKHDNLDDALGSYLIQVKSIQNQKLDFKTVRLIFLLSYRDLINKQIGLYDLSNISGYLFDKLNNMDCFATDLGDILQVAMEAGCEFCDYGDIERIEQYYLKNKVLIQ